MRTIHRVLTSACGVALLSMAAFAQVATTAPATQPTNLLRDAKFDDVGGTWQTQAQEGGELTATKDAAATRPTLSIDVTKVTETDWHVQVSQADLKLEAGKTYTLAFTGKASTPTKIVAFLQMLAEPYTMLSDRQEISLTTEPAEHKVTLVATQASTDGKLCLAVGTKVAKIAISDVTLTEAK